MGAEFSKHVDRFLDKSEQYQRAVTTTFSEYAKQLSQEGYPGIEVSQVLDVSRVVVKKLMDEMDSRAGKLCLREPTERDFEYVLFMNADLAEQDSLDLRDFQTFMRAMVTRVAVDRGRRILLFVAGGIFAIQMVKGTLRKVPLVGPPVVALVNVVLPTSVVGPAAGVAGALFLERDRE